MTCHFGKCLLCRLVVLYIVLSSICGWGRVANSASATKWTASKLPHPIKDAIFWTLAGAMSHSLASVANCQGVSV